MQGDHFLVLSNDHVDLQSGNYGELQPRVATESRCKRVATESRSKCQKCFDILQMVRTFHLYREDELFCCPMRGHSFCSTI